MLDDWPRRIEAAREMAARWDAQARRLGWTDADLYGLHPLRRGAAGAHFLTVATLAHKAVRSDQ